MGIFRKRPLASIVIPSRDEGENLKKTIESIHKNTDYGNYEIVVVDDGMGGDSTIALSFPGVKVLKTPTIGAAGARNTGAEAAGGEMLIFVDAHVSPITRQWLTEMVSLLKRKETGACGPCLVVQGHDESKGYGQTPKNLLFECDWLPKRTKKPFEVPFLCGACIGIRRDVFFEIGKWNPFFGVWGREDYELCLKAWLFGYTVCTIPSQEMYHLFREKFPYAVSWENVCWNIFITGFLHLNDARMRDVEQEINQIMGKGAAEKLRKRITPEIVAEKHDLRRKRKHDDSWFFTRFQLKF